MEKSEELEKKKRANISSESSDHVIWDCGSSLYDSFELKSFQTQIDAALVSKTLSMPHLSDRRAPPPPPVKKKSKIHRSFQRLVRAVFRSKSDRTDTNSYSCFEGFYVVYDDKAPTLSTIPENKRSATSRFANASPEIACSCN